MKEKPLYIPPNKRVTGLQIYCRLCDTNVSEKCKQTGKELMQCQHGEQHYYKVYIHEPGTKNVRRTKSLKTRSLDEARIEALQFKLEVQEGRVPNRISPTPNNEKVNSEENIPRLMTHVCARFIGRMHNENVPSQFKRERSGEHLKDIERACEVLLNSFNASGYDIKSFTVDQLNDKIAGRVFDFLENEKGFSNRTFNKYMQIYSSLLKWYAEEYSLPLKNVFKGIKKTTNYNPESISKEEFENLLKSIRHENGIIKYNSEKKPSYNIYRSWLPPLFKLFALTGGRREEVIQLKFSNLKQENGLSYFRIENFKVNKIKNRTAEAQKKYVFFPLTEELRALIMELGYEKNKGSDQYLIAPEIISNRTKMMSEIASRGFAHYYQQLETGRKLSLRCLRKTFITQMSIFLNGNAKSVTGHASDSILEQHYIDPKAILKVTRGFELFPKENIREEELTEVRDSSNQKKQIQINEKQKTNSPELE